MNNYIFGKSLKVAAKSTLIGVRIYRWNTQRCRTKRQAQGPKEAPEAQGPRKAPKDAGTGLARLGNPRCIGPEPFLINFNPGNV